MIGTKAVQQYEVRARAFARHPVPGSRAAHTLCLLYSILYIPAIHWSGVYNPTDTQVRLYGRLSEPGIQ